MRDPYNILGVERNASDDEVKKAYRELCRKYHPDKNPGNKSAEEMFKIVQEAYDQIMNERKMNAGSGYGGYGSYGNTGSYYADNGYDHDQNYYQAASNYINSGHYAEAINVLMSIQNRGAHWYYLSAMANAGLGNNYAAQEQARTAVSMEPGNMTYQQLLRTLQMGGMNYQNTQYMNYGGGTSDAGSFCMQLCMLNLCLNACCDSSCCC
ncbi:MAG: J domain-containing protein [Firmicutes bacterium]|nr:J domain-containing protein [Bacillota bacterium]